MTPLGQIAMASSISLHGADEQGITEEPKTGYASSILLKLSDEVLKDVKRAAQGRGDLLFVTGNAPVWSILESKSVMASR